MIRNARITISAFLAVVALACWAISSAISGVAVGFKTDRFSIGAFMPTTVSQEMKDAYRRDGSGLLERKKLDLSIMAFETGVGPLGWSTVNGKRTGSNWQRAISVEVAPAILLACVIVFPLLAATLKRFRPTRPFGRVILAVSSFLTVAVVAGWLTAIGASFNAIYVHRGAVVYHRMWPIIPSQDVLAALPTSATNRFSERSFDVGACAMSTYVAPKRWSSGGADDVLLQHLKTGADWRRVCTLTAQCWLLVVLFAAYPVVAFIRGPVRRWRRRRKGLCLGCGYDLTGNVTGVCPECGIEVKRS